MLHFMSLLFFYCLKLIGFIDGVKVSKCIRSSQKGCFFSTVLRSIHNATQLKIADYCGNYFEGINTIFLLRVYYFHFQIHKPRFHNDNRKGPTHEHVT